MCVLSLGARRAGLRTVTSLKLRMAGISYNFLLQRVYLWHFEDHLLQVSERIILFYFHFRHKRGVVWEPVLREKQREVLVFLLDKLVVGCVIIRKIR